MDYCSATNNFCLENNLLVRCYSQQVSVFMNNLHPLKHREWAKITEDKRLFSKWQFNRCKLLKRLCLSSLISRRIPLLSTINLIQIEIGLWKMLAHSNLHLTSIQMGDCHVLFSSYYVAACDFVTFSSHKNHPLPFTFNHHVSSLQLKDLQLQPSE